MVLAVTVVIMIVVMGVVMIMVLPVAIVMGMGLARVVQQAIDDHVLLLRIDARVQAVLNHLALGVDDHHVGNPVYAVHGVEHVVLGECDRPVRGQRGR